MQYSEPHVKRSSSMPFALRWQHEDIRVISITVLFLAAVTFMFFMLLYGTATKSVSLVVNGQERVVTTMQSDLKHLLDEQAIVIGDHDSVSLALAAKLRDGDTVKVDLALPVQLSADGETKTLYTTGKTVASVLEENGISADADDRIVPSPETALSSNMTIKVVRVDKKVEEQSVTLAFETVKKEDGNLEQGKERTVQEGKEGTKVIKTEKVYEDGALAVQQLVGESVVAESVSKVVAIGTKKPVQVLAASTSKPAAAKAKLVKTSAASAGAAAPGAPSGYKQILNNVTLTAYSAGPASTGKSPGHPGYGKTATGTTVTEGRTIAVDPSVIPLGWWVYIDGIGYRRAEDTGGAVKGAKIDVYYDSEDYADRFGLKRGYTVYVIGPKKPTGE